MIGGTCHFFVFLEDQMRRLNLPQYSLSVKSGEGGSQVFDPVRKKYVHLGPEEWVRQHFIQYLIRDRGFPAGLLAVEQSFYFNRRLKRADILAHDRKGQPVLLVECKSPDVPINQSVFEQIGLYNLEQAVEWLVVTNGLRHYCSRWDEISGSYRASDHIPLWTEVQRG